MPPKKERLTKLDFSGLTKKSTIKSHFFDLVYTPSNTHKVACVVLKKRTQKATERNSIKRKVYHLYKETRPKKPFIAIFYPKHEVLYTPYKKLHEEMIKIFATL